ncbi:bifunctional 2-polyprenyl-6-hydroxyphenol methylase/3-demethylubiquinol 3-O-methyltransferase UbiG [Lysobacter sp. HDW10]|uniref:bifunctional 2-polyprenyl-6-hydroxyphenol methylase/3-demethylubiquinol 3-O-methyltransferase UbiG n=1 Tax=Lysobacter sp. HDW10 TaxID=2714936 RepID=UPI001407860C|nr:bifunctional 2-polyprenyl-6-hydroxyphenol methylase/3-demethylubiquinol 3-O-methyltransferase UbiG [Lysobacter sp. HDW10]QIK81859.1 bifunctional 2-polyprenyl-6-hydroxyphenol methylase/3-demethylubiquinol 3-O-methyltransferase UbiG [Lysobacter sp. HDW10]
MTVHVNARQAELDKFGALASRWWDAQGPQKALHVLNPVRLAYIEAQAPLAGAKVLDVGCGGGLLSEAMARNGADVTAIDLAHELIEVAKLHALDAGVDVEYLLTPVEDLAETRAGQYDVVTCMEMLEHVPDPGAILAACARLLKPGGTLCMSTLNRTPAAFALAIVGAEYVARLLPTGTHQYRDFIKPAELAQGVRDAGLSLDDVRGIEYLPLVSRARLSTRTDINYLATARKPV